MARSALLAWLAVAAVACATPPGARGPGGSKPAAAEPSRWAVDVRDVAPVGPYLAATLASPRFERRFFFPPSDACRGLLRSTGEVRYRAIGPFGTLGDDTVRCEPVGVGSLREWRDALPRRRSMFLVPRDQAAFHALHADESGVLLRGRFPLTLEIRWPQPMDAVVWTAGGPACDALRAEETATMEFRSQGPEVFVLETDAGRCPVRGLALPLTVE